MKFRKVLLKRITYDKVNGHFMRSLKKSILVLIKYYT